ncbi:transcriptional repressor [Sphingobacterium corticibacterium]|uniref:Ferric uptake regulator family protein n=1 Tax=Sphingobacterium corticibacterium TaxID=2484746 RepID=A0A4Q6XQK7_9SPHI|nr:transcriptional repressor [Sphingobacterium corticibacterium]RZF59712.1 hypothetical protein EWE74_11190 [Sphingobacterium corticibacterium]
MEYHDEEDPMWKRLNEYCTGKYMTYSEKRWLVARSLRKHQDVIEVEDLWISLRTQGYQISLSCVYTSLNILVEAGVAIVERENRRNYYMVHPGYTPTSVGESP